MEGGGMMAILKVSAYILPSLIMRSHS